MKREEFICKFKDYYFNNKKLEDGLEKEIEYFIDKYKDIGDFRGHYNLIIAMEELDELSQAVSKCIRKKMIGEKVLCNSVKSEEWYDVLQEAADVCLSIKTIQELFGITDRQLGAAMDVKAEREYNRGKE